MLNQVNQDTLFASQDNVEDPPAVPKLCSGLLPAAQLQHCALPAEHLLADQIVLI